MRSWLEDRIAEFGSQRTLARHLGVSQFQIGNATSGRRPVSKRLAAALGFTRTITRTVCYDLISDKWEQTLDVAQMRELLREAIKEAGSQNKLSRATGISQRELSLAAAGRFPVSSRLARALGYRRRVERWICYRPSSWDSAVAA
jgi:DNA-binding transcriptional regulator YdaS (Cro superfamily)